LANTPADIMTLSLCPVCNLLWTLEVLGKIVNRQLFPNIHITRGLGHHHNPSQRAHIFLTTSWGGLGTNLDLCKQRNCQLVRRRQLVGRQRKADNVWAAVVVELAQRPEERSAALRRKVAAYALNDAAHRLLTNSGWGARLGAGDDVTHKRKVEVGDAQAVGICGTQSPPPHVGMPSDATRVYTCLCFH